MDWDAVMHDAGIVLTLLVLEAVLSFDNAAVLAAIVRKLPLQDRKKALLYGLVGAYTLRIAAILLASFLIQTPSLKVLGGLYLLFLGGKHFYQLARHHRSSGKEHKVSPGWLVRLGVPALLAVIIQIELIDLAFAVDQVVVAVAFTDEIVLIVIASMLGILFLRLAAAVVARVMDWLPMLEHMAYLAVSYVGFKLMLLHPWFVTGATVEGRTVLGGECRVPFIPVQHEVPSGGLPGCEIPTAISMTVTLGLFGIPILLKVLFGLPRSPTPSPPQELASAEAGEPSPTAPTAPPPEQPQQP